MFSVFLLFFLIIIIVFSERRVLEIVGFNVCVLMRVHSDDSEASLSFKQSDLVWGGS